MPLTSPTVADLRTWTSDSTLTATEGEKALRGARNLLYAATGILWADTPALAEGNAQLEEIVFDGIQDMAAWLLNYQDLSATLTMPFTSEHIGSYSYAKSRNAMELLTAGVPSGVMWFDIAVKLLGALAGFGPVLVSSTQVFGYTPCSLYDVIDSTTNQKWILSPTEKEAVLARLTISG